MMSRCARVLVLLPLVAPLAAGCAPAEAPTADPEAMQLDPPVVIVDEPDATRAEPDAELAEADVERAEAAPAAEPETTAEVAPDVLAKDPKTEVITFTGADAPPGMADEIQGAPKREPLPSMMSEVLNGPNK